MVCGQRQVGKSTMLYHLRKADRTYIILDNRYARRIAVTNPMLFFESYGTRLLIDKIPISESRIGPLPVKSC